MAGELPYQWDGEVNVTYFLGLNSARLQDALNQSDSGFSVGLDVPAGGNCFLINTTPQNKYALTACDYIADEQDPDSPVPGALVATGIVSRGLITHEWNKDDVSLELYRDLSNFLEENKVPYVIGVEDEGPKVQFIAGAYNPLNGIRLPNRRPDIFRL